MTLRSSNTGKKDAGSSSNNSSSSGNVGQTDWQRHNSTESTGTIKGPLAGRGAPVAVNTTKQYVISFIPCWSEREGGVRMP